MTQLLSTFLSGIGPTGPTGSTGPTGPTGPTGSAMNGWVIKTTTYTAIAKDQILANTTSGPFTITLPASPSAGDMIMFADYAGTWSTNNLTLANNGHNIQSAANLICNTSEPFTLVYVTPAIGWEILIAGGPTGPTGPVSTVSGPTGPTGPTGTQQWTAGTTSTVGAGLTLASGTLSLTQVGPVSSNVAIGTGSALTSGVNANVTSISLPAGDWIVYGNVGAQSFGSTTSVFGYNGWISTTSGTSGTPAQPNGGAFFVNVSPQSIAGGGTMLQSVGQIYMHLTTTTTVYLSIVTFFSGGGGFGCGGFIGAVPINATTP